MGFIGYLYAYIPNREGKRERREHKQQEKNISRKERGAEERSIK